MRTHPSWFVVTGVPCAGKTTTLRLLEARGYDVVDDVARLLVEERLDVGATLEAIRGDEWAFQQEVTRQRLAAEQTASRERTVLFDRSVVDSVVFHRLHDWPVDEALHSAASRSRFAAVLRLERVPAALADGVRTETPQQLVRLDDLIDETYASFGSRPLPVPVLPPEARADRVEAIVRRLGGSPAHHSLATSPNRRR